MGLCNVFFPPKKLPSNATDIYSIIIQTQNSPITEILHLVKKKKGGGHQHHHHIERGENSIVT